MFFPPSFSPHSPPACASTAPASRPCRTLRLQLKKLLTEDFRSLDDFKAKASQVRPCRGRALALRRGLAQCAAVRKLLLVGCSAGQALAWASPLNPSPPHPPPLWVQYKPHNTTQHSDKQHKAPHHGHGHKGGKQHGHGGGGKAANGAPPKGGRPAGAGAQHVHVQADAPAAQPANEPVAAASS